MRDIIWVRIGIGYTAHALTGRSGASGRARCGRTALGGSWYPALEDSLRCAKCDQLTGDE
jgi:hypothetical protein